eukprot:TCONS_00025847-protein
MWSLTKKVAGFSFVNPNIPALKYDRNMEPLAASNFLELMKTKHKGAKLVECGLFLDKEKPYIGASPDGVFFCDCCCEKICVEIKCPYSISHLSPTDERVSLPYMIKTDNALRLRKSHSYYTQCQFQMGILKFKKCYFFLYTAHGHVLEEIEFNEQFF